MSTKTRPPLTKAQHELYNALPEYPTWTIVDSHASFKKRGMFKNPDAQCRRMVAKGWLEIGYGTGTLGQAKFRKLKGDCHVW